MSFLTQSAGLVALPTPPTPPERAPLIGRQHTITTLQGLVLAFVVDRVSDGEPPDPVQSTCQAELWLHNHRRALVGTYDGKSWRSGWLGEDPERQAEIVAAAEEMLVRVQERRPPSASGATLGAVKRAFAGEDAGEIKLSREHGRQLDRMLVLRQRAREFGKRAKAIETRLRFAIGAHRVGVLPDGRQIKNLG